jgi:hypothetical protein
MILRRIEGHMDAFGSYYGRITFQGTFETNRSQIFHGVRTLVIVRGTEAMPSAEIPDWKTFH